LERPGPE
jgi:hypothetical protein